MRAPAPERRDRVRLLPVDLSLRPRANSVDGASDLLQQAFRIWVAENYPHLTVLLVPAVNARNLTDGLSDSRPHLRLERLISKELSDADEDSPGSIPGSRHFDPTGVVTQ